MSTIIVCLDLSNNAEKILHQAIKIVQKNQAKLHILAVIEGSHKNLLFGSLAISNQKHLQIQKHLKKLIDNVCATNNIMPTMSVREGEIVEEITKEVKAFNDCKLLIFGKSEKSQSDNVVLPKIVGKIGNKIMAPVMVIPYNIAEDFMLEIA
ncbi:MAG: universal stress protein [Alphaproteobacteria bacterium]